MIVISLVFPGFANSHGTDKLLTYLPSLPAAYVIMGMALSVAMTQEE